MNLRFLKDDCVYLLKNNVNSLKDYYKNDSEDWVKKITGREDSYGVFKREFVDFDLVVSDNPEKDDLENMKNIYNHLKELTDSQASDERLWAGLCHDKFWGYMHKRWPLPLDDKEIPRFILQHYFFNHGMRSVLLNGLSRLWWYARLTYDETNLDNPFELTEYLAKDINGKAYMLFGSNFSNNRNLQRIFLYTIKHFEEEHNFELKREEFNDLRKKMVLWSGKLLLDSLDENDMAKKITNELNKYYESRK